MSNVPSTILETTANLFRAAQIAIFEASSNLYRIKAENLWEGQFSSFGEYVENECGISQSFAAKLCKVYEHFVLKHKAKPA